ncbi:Vitamin B12 import ATP-binding protein BtuD [subsurface metagenome]
MINSCEVLEIFFTGTIFGILGPNGAGKTTLVRVLSTLLTPTSGRASVLGLDVVKNAAEVRNHIGLILGGERGLFARLTGKENLQYFAAINHMSPKVADRRADEMLEMLNLVDNPYLLVEQYSRGMKQRLHIARGLLTDPEIMFLDEPTIGLDPFGAKELRDLIPNLVERGKTVLLTTHYMFEADTLCNTIAMINKGSLVALGSPTEIKQQFSKITIVEVTIREANRNIPEEITKVEGVERVDTGVDGAFQKLIISTKVGVELQEEITNMIGGDAIENIITRDPTLEEAYLNILK